MPSKTGITRQTASVPARRSGNEAPTGLARSGSSSNTSDRTRAFLGVGRADGEFVDVAVLGPRARSRHRLPCACRLSLREIEDIAVGSWPLWRRRGVEGRSRIAAFRACAACAPARVDVVDEHAK